MGSWLKILRFFMDNKEESFSIRFIAKKLGLNYRIAFEEIKKLEKERIIFIKKLGNSNQCAFKYALNEKVFIAENSKKMDFLKNKALNVMYGRIMEIQNPFFIFLVFGSYAKGTQTKQSDIDLCLITDNPETEKKMQQVIRLIPFKTHLMNFTTNEFIAMIKTKEQNVGKEILKNNIIIKGIESFYELVNYAG